MKRICLIFLAVSVLMHGPSMVAEVSMEKEIRYHFQPHVITEEIREFFGEDFTDLFFGFCDALLNGDDSYLCPDSHTEFEIWRTAGSCFPIADKIAYADFPVGSPRKHPSGQAKIIYRYERATCQSLIKSFQIRVEDLLNASLPAACGDAEKALRLYRSFAREYRYDDEILNDSKRRLEEGGAYRTIMTGQGICWEIAAAYTYLLLQAGVDAGICCGIQENGDVHEWNIVKLDGKYYYVDPTYAVSSPDTLKYFGMTEAERIKQGSFLPDTLWVFIIGEIKAQTLDVTDEKFKPLWYSADYEIDHHQVLYQDNLGQQYTKNLEY